MRGAEQARHHRRQDQHRLEPLAEDDHGGVRDDGRRAGPLAERAGPLRQCRIQRQAGVAQVARRALIRDQLREPVLPVDPEPDERLDARHHAGGDRAQAELGPELEERVGLEPRLLGLPVFARRDRGLHAVEGEVDQVEVRLRVVLLPFIGEELVQQPGGALVGLLDVVFRDDPAAAAGVLDVALEHPERALDLGGRAGVALGELGLEVRECRGGAFTEGDRLLDLERDRDPSVVGAVAVFDRDEVEETQELRRAPGLLLGRERRRDEAVEARQRGPPGSRKPSRVA